MFRANRVGKTKFQLWLFVNLLIAVLPFQLNAQSTKQKTNRHSENVGHPNVIIVHGAWGGRHQWKLIASKLENSTSAKIYRASLTGLGERSHLASPTVNLETHIQDVIKLIECEELDRVILIGHSYGGMVISGVAESLPGSISNLLFLDAYLPDDGETFFSHHPDFEKKLIKRAKESGDGWKIPVDWPNPMGDVAHPLATLTQAIQLDVKKIQKIPSHYWLFTDGGDKENDKLFCFFSRAKSRNYSTKTFPWGHNPHRNNVIEFTEALKQYIQSVSKS